MIEKLNNIEVICKKAKDASYKLAVSSNEKYCFKLIANQILKSINKIINANEKTIELQRKIKFLQPFLTDYY